MNRKQPRARTAIVRSNKMDKSAIVEVVRFVKHPLYKKYVKRLVRYMAHDASNNANIGDEVRIISSRPLSARKRWRIIETTRTAR
jgi:small subunit ribosomal protein S17